MFEKRKEKHYLSLTQSISLYFFFNFTYVLTIFTLELDLLWKRNMLRYHCKQITQIWLPRIIANNCGDITDWVIMLYPYLD